MASRGTQKKAYHYLRRISNLSSPKCLSSEEFLDILKKLKNSSLWKEKELFSCLMRTLHNEWQFFPNYSYKVLMKFANILGGTVEYDLISDSKNVNLTLQLVLDALRQRPDTKMYNFGLTALSRFIGCLSDCQDYFLNIAKIPKFNKFPLHIIQCVEKNLEVPIMFSKVKSFDKSLILYSPFNTPVEVMQIVIEEDEDEFDTKQIILKI